MSLMDLRVFVHTNQRVPPCTWLLTDLQLIPLNTTFPPQFISEFKVLRFLIAPKTPTPFNYVSAMFWTAHLVVIAKLLMQ